MADVPKRWGPTIGTGSAATLYTAPAGGFIWRSLSIANTTTSAVTFKLSIGADAAGTRLYGDVSVPANGVLDWSGFRWLGNAETIQWTAAAGLTATGSGVEQ